MASNKKNNTIDFENTNHMMQTDEDLEKELTPSTADDDSVSFNDASDDDDNSADFSATDLQFDDDDGNTHGGSIREKQQVKRDAKKEIGRVSFWRTVFLLVCFLSACAGTFTVYFILTKEYSEDFDVAFSSYAHSVEKTAQKSFQTTLEEIKTLSHVFTKYAQETEQQPLQRQRQRQLQDPSQQQQEQQQVQQQQFNIGLGWPLVTLPAFEASVSHTREAANAGQISIVPFVTKPEQLWDWNFYSRGTDANSWLEGVEPNKLFVLDENGDNVEMTEQDISSSSLPASPVWQTSPPPPVKDIRMINFNILSVTEMQTMYEIVSKQKQHVIGPVNQQSIFERYNLKTSHNDTTTTDASALRSELLYPIFRGEKSGNEEDGDIVGMIYVDFYWSQLLSGGYENEDSKYDETSILYVVLRNTCGQSYTYFTRGHKYILLGEGDLHDKSFDSMEHVIRLSEYNDAAAATITEDANCFYSLSVYPTPEMESVYATKKPLMLSGVVVIVFVLLFIIFMVFNWYVDQQYSKLIGSAAQSNKLLSSLFPSTFRDRLFNANNEIAAEQQKEMDNNKGGAANLKSYLTNEGANHQVAESSYFEDNAIAFKTKPIADLYPEVTIMFTDMVGFTAWSSVREPSQVFTLLESIYHAFDQIAKKRKVFKVETVGDSYVAVAGLPEPRADHAVIMARFANDCLKRMHVLTKKLEVALGPDTGDLTMRCGLHSGPVTAGVLRGERSRFQLFGDTMNTASRMESTGVKDKIQVSQETADLLIASGKVHWLEQREDKVIAKGKGEVETYFINIDPIPKIEEEHDEAPDQPSDDINYADQYDVLPRRIPSKDYDEEDPYLDKNLRLIDWNVEVLIKVLKLIAARRATIHNRRRSSGAGGDLESLIKFQGLDGRIALDEVREVIHLPKFDAKAAKRQKNPELITLPDAVEDQLRDYVSKISLLYRNNPFHNFEHASHVMMSVSKLLSRIVEPTDLTLSDDLPGKDKKKVASELHGNSYGITSDPLTQFACLFSALIHDVDHTGVPNTVVAKENPTLSSRYRGKSIAEQNSLDIAWGMLMEPDFAELRQAIYSNPDEMIRFRQLCVNSVMATDIMDKDLKALRNGRWDKAFSEQSLNKEGLEENVNRKATIVIEHLIQASDVSHTMQHWHIYRKWNERLFLELLTAFRQGRSEYDPRENWYDGELGFFDFYVIPLAKKLKDCQVFGVSSDEYLNYAERNRHEFAERGREVVNYLIEKFAD